MFSWWWKCAISTTLQSSIPNSSQLNYCILSWLPDYPKMTSVSPKHWYHHQASPLSLLGRMAKAPSEICNHTVEWHRAMKASVFSLHSSEFIQGPLRKRLTTMTHKALSAPPVTTKLIGKWLIQKNLLSCSQVSKKCCYILMYEVLMR